MGHGIRESGGGGRGSLRASQIWRSRLSPLSYHQGYSRCNKHLDRSLTGAPLLSQKKLRCVEIGTMPPAIQLVAKSATGVFLGAIKKKRDHRTKYIYCFRTFTEGLSRPVRLSYYYIHFPYGSARHFDFDRGFRYFKSSYSSTTFVDFSVTSIVCGRPEKCHNIRHVHDWNSIQTVKTTLHAAHPSSYPGTVLLTASTVVSLQ